ncbi:deoxyribose-phosphate aldolase [bacterium]|nr:deoxyribose-phosphate aldolase [bacterium]
MKELNLQRCDGICLGCEECIVQNPQGTQAIIDAGASRISSSLGIFPTNKEIAKFIDHTLLKANVTESDIRKLCSEAKEYHFASVCVNPYWVPLCHELLENTDVKIATVIGFPLGATPEEIKVFEAKQALQNGADEFDMVINIGALKSDNLKYVFEDTKSVVDAVAPNTVKVIIETALLTDEEKVEACTIAKEAGAHFVKTSTGFSSGGATVDDVRLMKAVVDGDLQIKASGGIHDYETALEMIKAGATRIGASAGIAIVKG